MSAISINISQELAEATRQMAKQFGMSRSQLIKQAIRHEIENLEKEIILKSMAKDLKKLKKNAEYLKSTADIESLDEIINEDEEDEWWKN